MLARVVIGNRQITIICHVFIEKIVNKIKRNKKKKCVNNTPYFIKKQILNNLSKIHVKCIMYNTVYIINV